MTPKQKQLLEHICMNGGEDVSGFSGVVLSAAMRKGWIEINKHVPFTEAYGYNLNESWWLLTDEGRRALHEGGK